MHAHFFLCISQRLVAGTKHLGGAAEHTQQGVPEALGTSVFQVKLLERKLKDDNRDQEARSRHIGKHS